MEVAAQRTPGGGDCSPGAWLLPSPSGTPDHQNWGLSAYGGRLTLTGPYVTTPGRCGGGLGSTLPPDLP